MSQAPFTNLWALCRPGLEGTVLGALVKALPGKFLPVRGICIPSINQKIGLIFWNVNKGLFKEQFEGLFLIESLVAEKAIPTTGVGVGKAQGSQDLSYGVTRKGKDFTYYQDYGSQKGPFLGKNNKSQTSRLPRQDYYKTYHPLPEAAI